MTSPFNDEERPENAIPGMVGEYLKAKMNTAAIAIVTEFDGKNRVTVQPVIKQKFRGHDSTPALPISDVLLKWPGAGDYWVTFKDDNNLIGSWVLLVCSQRSIDSWKNSTDGDVIDATTPRRFSMSDAIAIPGILPFSKGFEVNTGLELRNKNGDVKISLKDDVITATNGDGTLTIKSGGQIDLNGNLTVDV